VSFRTTTLVLTALLMWYGTNSFVRNDINRLTFLQHFKQTANGLDIDNADFNVNVSQTLMSL
jgi:hypothetical protein